jgi:two-component system, OmpR family, heavy metal sensor histidine kinase CusS
VRRSITTRLVAMFALGALLTFTLIGTALYGVLQRELTRHQNDDLNTNLQNMRYSIERFGDLEHWARLQVKMDTLSPADGSVRFWVLSDDARFQYGKGLDEMERVNQGEAGRGTLTLPLSGRTYRTLSMRLAPFNERPAVRLIVGVDMAPFDHTLRTFLMALTLLLLGAVAVVTVLGWWIARIGLRPLQRLSEQARALRPKTLSQRLRLERLPVELEDLTVAFNGALGRLEDAYRQLEAFNADVAHELRTPLANMIGGTQVALSRPRSAVEFEETLQSNLEELERLRSIVNDMLFLARADQGEAATGLTAADVAHEVEMTIEFFEPLLDETGATVAIEGDLRIRATMNVALFRRALSNLLQNAIEHSAAQARLVVSISRRGGAIWIAVANPGATIAATHLPRLFDRFYRVDSSRHDAGDVRGHGLGLAIVKAVASMHGGATLATSDAGVTTIAFSLADAQ